MHLTAEQYASARHHCGLAGEQVTLQELESRLAALGYKLDRAMDCRSNSRCMTGPWAGVSYPCCTTGVKESDSGMSAFHYKARRDSNFRALQALRLSGIFVLLGKAVLEV